MRGDDERASERVSEFPGLLPDDVGQSVSRCRPLFFSFFFTSCQYRLNFHECERTTPILVFCVCVCVYMRQRMNYLYVVL